MIILGLDLGISSIGWALIEVDSDHRPIRILGMGSRIIPLSTDELSNFERGRGETVCAQRTLQHTARKGLDRYQMRRATLTALLTALGMNDEKERNRILALPPVEMWQLRANAATEGCQLSLTEIGRVLLHINQKRGYRHSKSDSSSSDTKYVQTVNENFRKIRDLDETIGQHHYRLLKESEVTKPGGRVVLHRIKGTVYPRKAYMEEFDRIMSVQRKFYPTVLTDENIGLLRDTIFFQRPLKSCKHLVSVCEFEKRSYLRADGTAVESGPKVAPRTSPLAQVTRIYEDINNIRLVNPRNRDFSNPDSIKKSDGSLPRDARLLCYEYPLSDEDRQRIFEYLNTHSSLSASNLLKLLGLKKSDGFIPDEKTKKGLKGNDTFSKIAVAVGYDPDKADPDTMPDFLRFHLDVTITDKVDKETGELIKTIDPSFVNQPLYRLWHLLYSVSDSDLLSKSLLTQFGISDPEVLSRLTAIDFVTPGFSNRSARFMRRILPYLMQGFVYSEACTMIGVNHSGYVTSEENAARQLLSSIPLLGKNTLRQPTVEKILNQMINVVNAVIRQYGPIDECRVELARALKQSKEERDRASSDISRNERDNKKFSELISELGLTPSRSRIQKYRLWLETGHQCMYCGATIGLKEFIESHDAEVEHIIPRSIYFDDSMSNKTCACRKCNKEKNNRTAFDFMKSDDSRFPEYIDRVERLFAEKAISKRKHDYLLMSKEQIPDDFLNRDLRLTQYIAKKSCEILRSAIRDVTVSSGRVTDFFRHSWGYDRILHDLNLPRYEAAGLTVVESYEHKGQTHNRRVIKDWSKRLDHRHHAIDALTVALTRQAYIQRLNTLASTRPEILSEIESSGESLRQGKSLIEQWAESRPHFSVAEVSATTDTIAVSFKAGKKVTTPAKRKEYKRGKAILRQTGIQVPRGALHKETVYGRVLVPDGLKPIKYAFEHSDLIINNKIRKAVRERISEYSGDIRKALASLKKVPLSFRSKGDEKIVSDKIKCFRWEYVVRKSLSSLVSKQFDDILDPAIREAVWQRFNECGKTDKSFQTSIASDPVRLPDSPLPINSVRVVTGISDDSMVVIRKNSSGEGIGYSQARNNHHVAFYQDEKGKIQSTVVSFWDTVRRKLNNIPIVITNPEKAWDALMEIEDEQIREEMSKSFPLPSWQFLMSMSINDMFVVGLSDDEFADAVRSNDRQLIASHLYRVQKLSDGIYYLRLNFNTVTDIDSTQKALFGFIYLSNSSISKENLQKVKIDVLGNIIYDQADSRIS